MGLTSTGGAAASGIQEETQIPTVMTKRLNARMGSSTRLGSGIQKHLTAKAGQQAQSEVRQQENPRSFPAFVKTWHQGVCKAVQR